MPDLNPVAQPWGQVLRDRGISVKDFAAAGDGVTDDTTAIQAALNAARAIGGAIVHCPPGTYKITSTLLLYSYTVLRGAGWKTVLKTSAAIPIIRGTDPTNGLVEGCGIEDMLLDGTSVGTGATGAYWTKYVAGSPITAGRNNWMKGVKVQNCATGVQMVFDQGFAMYSCAIHSNGTGMAITDDSQNGTCVQCDFRYNTVAGTLLQSTNLIKGGSADRIYGWKFDRCHWELNTGKGVVLDGATNNTFDTCKWEANSDDFIRTTDVNSTYRPDGNTFINCIWNGTAIAPTVLQFNMLKGWGTTFLGGVFNPTNTNGVLLDNASNHTTLLNSVVGDSTKFVDNSATTWYFMPSGGLIRNTLSDLPYTTLTYSTNIATNAGLGNIFFIVTTDGVAFTIANPTNAHVGQIITYDIYNGTAGAMGAITWGSEFKKAGAFTNPAGFLRRTISFYRTNAATWIETSRAAADI